MTTAHDRPVASPGEQDSGHTAAALDTALRACLRRLLPDGDSTTVRPEPPVLASLALVAGLELGLALAEYAPASARAAYRQYQRRAERAGDRDFDRVLRAAVAAIRDAALQAADQERALVATRPHGGPERAAGGLPPPEPTQHTLGAGRTP